MTENLWEPFRGVEEDVLKADGEISSSVCLLCNLHVSSVKVYSNLWPILEGRKGGCILVDAICYFHLGLHFRNPDGSLRSLQSHRHFKLPFLRCLVSSRLWGIYHVSVTKQDRLTSGDLIFCSPVILRNSYYQPRGYRAGVWQRKHCCGVPRGLPPLEVALQGLHLSTSEVSMLRILQRTGRSEVVIYMSLSKDIHLCQLNYIAVVTQGDCHRSSQPLHLRSGFNPSFIPTGCGDLWQTMATLSFGHLLPPPARTFN